MQRKKLPASFKAEPEQPSAPIVVSDDNYVIKENDIVINLDSKCLTGQQQDARDLLLGPQRWTCLVGGSRSGKTFLICRHIVARALRAPNSRHLIVRWHQVDAWTSIGLETLPKVLEVCCPELKYEVNGSFRYFQFPNGSQIWVGGLGDKDSADKVLGREYATIFCNEVSQIAYSSIVLVRSRLAQVCRCNNGTILEQRGVYDLNPVGKGHWSNVEFGDKMDPVSRKKLDDADEYQRTFMNPEGHKQYLDPKYLQSLRNMPARQRARFYEGRYVDEVSNALWTFELIERCRLKDRPMHFQRIVVAVDPSGAKNELDTTHDMIGIVVVGMTGDRKAYVLDDRTMLGSPKQWAHTAIAAFHFWQADAIVAETNFGGAMVANTINVEDSTIKVIEVKASRGKVVRAEPCSALYGDPAEPNSPNHPPRVYHCGHFADLENEMTQFTDMGYVGERSPNRVDALVWALTELMLGDDVSGWLGYYEDMTAHARGELTTEEKKLKNRPSRVMKGVPYHVYAPATGVRYTADERGMIYQVEPDHVEALKKSGCSVEDLSGDERTPG